MAIDPDINGSEHSEPKVVADLDGENDHGVSTLKQIRKEQRRVLFRSPAFIIGCVILAFWVVASIVPELLTAIGPKDPVRNASGGTLVSRSPGSGGTLLGTDRLGRSVWSRIIFGARPIMIAAPVATAIATIAGTLLGLLTGYFGGWVDEIISRILEAILAIPAILLAIVIVFTFGPTFWVIVGTIAFLFVPPLARTVRAATLAEGRLDYVTAAKMRGENWFYIITREIFPNVTSVVVVEATVRLAYAVFLLATLAFLGLSGGNVTDANWGVDVADNFSEIVADVWWPTVFPALAIGSLVVAVNAIADSIDKANNS